MLFLLCDNRLPGQKTTGHSSHKFISKMTHYFEILSAQITLSCECRKHAFVFI